jgi:hypothetical protein
MPTTLTRNKLEYLREQHPEARPWPRCPQYLVYPDGTIIGPRGNIVVPYVPTARNSPFKAITVRTEGQPKSFQIRVIVAETYLEKPSWPARVVYTLQDGVDSVDNIRWARIGVQPPTV